MLNTISGEHKEARSIEGHCKSGPGKSGDYCIKNNVRISRMKIFGWYDTIYTSLTKTWPTANLWLYHYTWYNHRRFAILIWYNYYHIWNNYYHLWYNYYHIQWYNHKSHYPPTLRVWGIGSKLRPIVMNTNIELT